MTAPRKRAERQHYRRNLLSHQHAAYSRRKETRIMEGNGESLNFALSSDFSGTEGSQSAPAYGLSPGCYAGNADRRKSQRKEANWHSREAYAAERKGRGTDLDATWPTPIAHTKATAIDIRKSAALHWRRNKTGGGERETSRCPIPRTGDFAREYDHHRPVQAAS